MCLCFLATLEYSDDTAMARCVVQSLLTRGGFDEQDMAHRYYCGTKTLLANGVNGGLL